MAFSISHWLLRRRIDEMRTSGRAMEHRRVGNPYHAVSIDTGLKACTAALDIEGRRFLANEAPMLPLAGCTLTSCRCRYEHHEDRRSDEGRRVQPHNPYAHKLHERRKGTGRRMTD